MVLDHPVFEHVDEKRCFLFFRYVQQHEKTGKVLSCLDALDGIIVLTLSTALISIFARYVVIFFGGHFPVRYVGDVKHMLTLACLLDLDER